MTRVDNCPSWARPTPSERFGALGISRSPDGYEPHRAGALPLLGDVAHEGVSAADRDWLGRFLDRDALVAEREALSSAA